MNLLAKYLFLSMAAVVAFAGDVYAGSCRMTFVDTGNDTVKLTDVKLDGLGRVDVPATNGNKIVTAIDAGAFGYSPHVQEVTIPDSVRTIGAGAFSRCPTLRAISVAAENPAFYSITGVLFERDGHAKDTATLLCHPADRSATAYSIPSNVTAVADQAFAGCVQLKQIILSEGIAKVGARAFQGCVLLKTMALPSSLAHVGPCAFSDCPALKTITVSKWNERFSTAGVALTGPEPDTGEPAVIRLPPAQGTTLYAVPTSVVAIAGGAFDGCTELKAVNFHPRVVRIGEEAFCACAALKTANVPDSVKDLGASAFRGCTSLRSASVSSNVVSVGSGVYSGCTGITAIDVSCSNAAYRAEDGVLFGPSTLLGYPAGRAAVQYAVPTGVTEIGDYAFAASARLRTLEIPWGLSCIGKFAFVGCSDLLTLTVPSSVSSVGCEAFVFSSAKTKLTFCGRPPSRIDLSGIDSTATVRFSSLHSNEWARVVRECGWKKASSVPVSRIVFSANGGTFADGSGSQMRELLTDEPFGTLPEPALETYLFDGWHTAPEGGEEIDSEDVVVSNAVYYAHWKYDESIPVYFSVTFHAAGGQFEDGTNTLVRQVLRGERIGALPEATREDYLFDGWFEGPHSAAEVFADTVILSNVDFYARWTRDETVTVFADLAELQVANYQGSGEVTSGSAQPGEEAVVKAVADESSVFAGWFTEPRVNPFDEAGLESAVRGEMDFRTPEYAYVVSQEDVTLYALFVKKEADEAWLRIEAADSYEVSGPTLIQPKIDSLSLPDVTASGLPEGLACDRMTGAISGMPTTPGDYTVTLLVSNAAASVTRTFQIVVKSYAGKVVTFDANGGTCDETERYVEDGAAVGTLPVPTRPWHRFDGWFTDVAAGEQVDENTPVAEDVTYHAHWTYDDTVQVEVDFVVLSDPSQQGMGEITGGSAKKGASVTVTAVADEVSVFAGWYLDPEGKRPVEGDVDYRTPEYPYVATGNNVTLYAKFVSRDVDKGLLKVDTADSYEVDGPCRIVPTILSLSLPNVAASGLPRGLACDPVTGVITGSPLVAGDYMVTLLVSNATRSRSRTFEIVVTKGSGKAVTFEANGGSCTEPLRYVEPGAAVGSLPVPIRTKHTFDGWYTEAEGGVRITEETPVTEDVTYYAHWSYDTSVLVTVSRVDSQYPEYEGNGTISGGSAKPGGVAMVKADADADSVFAGWFTVPWATALDSDLTAEYAVRGEADFRTPAYPYTVSETDVTLYAQFLTREADQVWTGIEMADVYEVGGPCRIEPTIYSLSLPTVTAVGLPDGLVCDAVTGVISGTPQKAGDYTVTLQLSNASTLMTQTFRIVVTEGSGWTVTLDPNGGTCGEAFRFVRRDAAVGALPVPIRSRHTFLGWFTSATGGSAVTANTPVTDDVTYYAHWVRNETAQVFVDYVALQDVAAQGFGEIAGGAAKPGATVTVKAVANESSAFVGWYLDSRGRKPVEGEADYRLPEYVYVVGDEDVTLYAKFVERKVDEAQLALNTADSYEVDGPCRIVPTVASLSLPTVTASGLPLGLACDPLTGVISGTPVVAGSYAVTLQIANASGSKTRPFEIVVTRGCGRTVTFDACGGTCEETTRAVESVGVAVGTLPEAIRARHAFDGWFTEADGGELVTGETTVADDVTYYAHWTFDGSQLVSVDCVNPQYSSFVGRGTVTGGCAQPGETVVLKAVADESSAFAGWFTDPEGNPWEEPAMEYALRGEADYRSPEYPYVVSQEDVTLYALFVTHAADRTWCGLKPEKSYEVDGPCRIEPTVYSLSLPRVTATGLPPGLTCDALTGVISGTPKTPGEYNVTLWLTNASASASTNFLIVVTQGTGKTVTFDANGGSCEVETRYVDEGAAVGTLPVPIRPKHKFDGWFTSPTGGTKVTNTTKVPADITYYAHWTYAESARVDAEPVAGSSGTGTVSGGKTAKGGSKVTLKATAAKGSVFAGWFVDAEGAVPYEGSADYRTPSLTQVVGEEDIMLYAKFIAAADDWASVDAEVADEYAPKQAIEPVVLNLDCGSLPAVKVTGLPAGLKFTAKALDVKATKTTAAAHYEPNTIYGTPTKSGVCTTTVTVTTAGKATATKTVTFVVIDREKGENFLKIDCDSTRGKATGAGIYKAGAKVTLKATANKGYVFAGWYEADALGERALPGSVDYRTPTFAYVASGADETVCARFAPASEDREIALFADGKEIPEGSASVDFQTDGELTLKLDAESVSVPKIAVSGLPAGLKFTTKEVLNKDKSVLAEANSIYGTATKPGLYAVTVKLTNTTVKKAIERKFTITVSNLTGANALLQGQDDEATRLRNLPGEKYVISIGVTECDVPELKPASSGTLKVTGLPAGLKYDAKTGLVTGVATKAGAYTVTVTVGKAVSTFTIVVEALPDWVIGTFVGLVRQVDRDSENDWQVVEDEHGRHDWYDILTTVTIASNGKVSGKLTLPEGDSASFAFGALQCVTEDGFFVTGARDETLLTAFDMQMRAKIFVGRSVYDETSSEILGNVSVELFEQYHKSGRSWLERSQKTSMATDVGAPLYQNVWPRKDLTKPPVANGATASVDLEGFKDVDEWEDPCRCTFKFGKDGKVTAALFENGNLSKAVSAASATLTVLERAEDCWRGEICVDFVIKKGAKGRSGIFDILIGDDGAILSVDFRIPTPVNE